MSDIAVKQTENVAFQLKGSLFTLTVLSLHSLDLRLIRQQLDALIKATPKFFQSTPVVLDFTQLSTIGASDLDIGQLLTCLKSHKLIPVAIRGANPALKALALEHGLAPITASKDKVDASESSYGYRIKKSKEKYQQLEQGSKTQETQETPTTIEPKDEVAPVVEPAPAPAAPPAAGSIVITKPVRSGQQIYARGADLVVLSSVSHGAELLADGNIHIYGSLNGRALAGVQGNENTHVFCKRLDAELIAIAGHYQVREDIKVPAGDGMINVYFEAGELRLRRL